MLEGPLDVSKIKMTFSVEGWDTDKEERRCASFGFSIVSGHATPMEESEAASRLSGYWPDTTVFLKPDLKVVTINKGSLSPSSNRAAMTARATTYAENTMALAQPIMRTLIVKGFLPVDIDGCVSQVEYDPVNVVTVITCFGWSVPAITGGTAFRTGHHHRGIHPLGVLIWH